MARQIDHFLIDSDRAIGAQARFEQTQNEQTQKKRARSPGSFAGHLALKLNAQQ
jgi:hypothetical protein